MILDQIVAKRRHRISEEMALHPFDLVRRAAERAPGPRDFAAAVSRRDGAARVIAEIKLASPSAGIIAAGVDPIALAREYEAGGAAAISVLTEPDFFGGSIERLALLREHTSLPLLMKDFIFDRYQVAQGRAAGADAVLLIVKVTGEKLLGELYEFARELGMEALVEVHSPAELEIAARSGARIIGVNSRDLDTLRVDLNVLRELARMALPATTVLVAESGLSTRREIEELSGLGYQAFLVGTHLVKSRHPANALRELIGVTP